MRPPSQIVVFSIVFCCRSLVRMLLVRSSPPDRTLYCLPFPRELHNVARIVTSRHYVLGLWRNGSALDSRSRGWAFDSLWAHKRFLFVQVLGTSDILLALFSAMLHRGCKDLSRLLLDVAPWLQRFVLTSPGCRTAWLHL